MKELVGVMDSGVGGLTILKQLTERSSYNFLYVADHAYCPYGTKPEQVVLRRADTVTAYFRDVGASAVVIACNTASRFADRLSDKYGLPVYDVVRPTCRQVLSITKNKRVALLATNATVKGGAYRKLLEPSGITVYDFPCSSFVPFIEQNATDTLSCFKAADEALSDLPKCGADTVILGCTHFPLMLRQIAYYCAGAQIVQCGCDLPCGFSQEDSAVKYLTTGNVDFAANASKWYGDVRFEHISL